MTNSKDVNTILILSSWSTGSTAVTGFLEKFSCYIPQPCVSTNDPLTPSALEPKEYRDILVDCFDELSLQLKKPKEIFLDFFSKWHPLQEKNCTNNDCKFLLLKHPLQAFFLDQIFQICDPTIIVVTRPFDLIEKTRLRRKWPATYGIAGAETIYSTIYSELQNKSRRYLAVPYESFLENDKDQDFLLNYCSIKAASKQLQEGRNFIRR